MRRALQLARNGEGRVSPNPMVGAVIVNDGRIIGEGFHAFFGGPHAEVNAVNSVKPQDLHLLKNSTIYVTLEPCAHHGKTPPCANLLVDSGIPSVVIGSPDPNPLVAGKGVKILRDAGVEVETGVLREECDELNRRFLKAQTSSLPFITLKWAQSADGYIAAFDSKGSSCPVKFSSLLSSVDVHRLRSVHDVIMVGANTEKIDHPQLNVRLWGGNSPKKIVMSSSRDLKETLIQLRKEGVSSLLVEGGAKLLNSFIKEGLWDEIRVEIAPQILRNGLKAPDLPEWARLKDNFKIRDNTVLLFSR